MRALAVLIPLLLASACDPANAPAEKVAEQAAAIVDPQPSQADPVAKGRFAPRNECAAIEGANAFRQQIIEAVQLRDSDTLLDLVADDIKLDFGGGAGKAELRKRLTDPSLNLWHELEVLLALGCAKSEHGGITIPWIAAQNLGDTDPYSALLVTGEDVSVLPEARATATPLGAISWDLVEALAFTPQATFQRVKLPDGREGFIATDKLRSPLDYRLIASPRNGTWSVTSLVAGD